MRQLANLLHMLLCDKDHAEQMIDMLQPRVAGVCYWYLEEKVAEEDKDICLDHQYWENEAKAICEQLGTNEIEAIRAIHLILEARRLLEPLLSRSAKSRELVVRLLRIPSC